MPAPTKGEELIIAAFRLSQAAPQEWGEFLQSLEAYAVRVNQQMLNAEPALLLNCQGQALQAQHILNMLTGARDTVRAAEKLRNARKSENTQWPSKSLL